VQGNEGENMITLIIKYSPNLLNYFFKFFNEMHSSVTGIYSFISDIYLSIVIDLITPYLCGSA